MIDQSKQLNITMAFVLTAFLCILFIGLFFHLSKRFSIHEQQVQCEIEKIEKLLLVLPEERKGVGFLVECFKQNGTKK